MRIRLPKFSNLILTYFPRQQANKLSTVHGILQKVNTSDKVLLSNQLHEKLRTS